MSTSLAYPADIAPSLIAPGESIQFYPTYVRDLAAGRWRLGVHGIVFTPARQSLVRAALLKLLRKLLRLSDDETKNVVFQERIRGFLIDTARGREVSIETGDRTGHVGTTAKNGHFRGSLDLSDEDLKRAGCRSGGWLSFQTLLPADDDRRFEGRAQVVPAEGLSIISDIDDTIKLTGVGELKAMIANTFVHPFEAVSGMAARYRQWAAGGGTFHYVSASPWQLFRPLAQFFHAEGFPEGSLHLKSVRLRDTSVADLFQPAVEFKMPIFEQILRDFPKRRFVLVGDAGESDPEIFGELARKNPCQVERILIRQLDGEPSSPRWEKAFAGLPPNCWQLFAHADALPETLP